MQTTLSVQLANANYDTHHALALFGKNGNAQFIPYQFSNANELLTVVHQAAQMLLQSRPARICLLFHTHVVTDGRTKNTGDFVLEMKHQGTVLPLVAVWVSVCVMVDMHVLLGTEAVVVDGHEFRCAFCRAGGTHMSRPIWCAILHNPSNSRRSPVALQPLLASSSHILCLRLDRPCPACRRERRSPRGCGVRPLDMPRVPDAAT